MQPINRSTMLTIFYGIRDGLATDPPPPTNQTIIGFNSVRLGSWPRKMKRGKYSEQRFIPLWHSFFFLYQNCAQWVLDSYRVVAAQLPWADDVILIFVISSGPSKMVFYKFLRVLFPLLVESFQTGKNEVSGSDADQCQAWVRAMLGQVGRALVTSMLGNFFCRTSNLEKWYMYFDCLDEANIMGTSYLSFEGVHFGTFSN